MFLKSIKYSEFDGTPKSWDLDFIKLNEINLIVGKNASGKTRLLKLINGLAKLLSGEEKLIYVSGNYEVEWENKKQTVVYKLNYSEKKVVLEELVIDGKVLLERGKDGIGKIWGNEFGKLVSFQTPVTDLACVSRRDSVQHPFFEDLFQWGKRTLFYEFGTSMGREQGALNISQVPSSIDLKDSKQIVGITKLGLEKYGEKFEQIVKKDMKSIGYNLEKISIDELKPDQLINPSAPDLALISIKEFDLSSEVLQVNLSQGMFRALSLILQINYAQFEKFPLCILIDDVGEGIDFERSSMLVQLLINKVEKSKTQLLLTTNNKFVMNNVPLEYWSIIHRTQNHCKIYNHFNSKSIFNEFKYTGLSNFDFLSTDFFLNGFEEE